jgi:adenine/guanine phosphoribosyltransferase-like PRPP-binding protein
MSPASKARLAKVSAAMSRITGENRWHVFPAEGRWVILRDRAQRATRVLPSRSEAIALARTLAEDAGGEVIIHRKDGTLQERQVADRASGRLETVYSHSGSPD